MRGRSSGRLLLPAERALRRGELGGLLRVAVAGGAASAASQLCRDAGVFSRSWRPGSTRTAGEAAGRAAGKLWLSPVAADSSARGLAAHHSGHEPQRGSALPSPCGTRRHPEHRRGGSGVTAAFAPAPRSAPGAARLCPHTLHTRREDAPAPAAASAESLVEFSSMIHHVVTSEYFRGRDRGTTLPRETSAALQGPASPLALFSDGCLGFLQTTREECELLILLLKKGFIKIFF